MDALLDSNVAADIKAFASHWQSARSQKVIPTLPDYLSLPAFAQQKNTAIVDVLSAGVMRFRLFGTGLNELSGVELTGDEVLGNFDPRARSEAARIAWSAVQQPCGYLLQRTMTNARRETTADGIGLPLLHPQSGRICLVGFTSDVAKQAQWTSSDDNLFVTAVKMGQWIDIGAGVPER